jgi:RNA polymerase sigma-70 factor (ECF subfamily)
VLDSTPSIGTTTTSNSTRRARFEALWGDHYEAVVRFALRRAPRDRAPDIAEETFLAAWRRLDEIPADAGPWLYGVARGVLANDRRSQRRGGAPLQHLSRGHKPVSRTSLL